MNGIVMALPWHCYAVVMAYSCTLFLDILVPFSLNSLFKNYIILNVANFQMKFVKFVQANA